MSPHLWPVLADPHLVLVHKLDLAVLTDPRAVEVTNVAWPSGRVDPQRDGPFAIPLIQANIAVGAEFPPYRCETVPVGVGQHARPSVGAPCCYAFWKNAMPGAWDSRCAEPSEAWAPADDADTEASLRVGCAGPRSCSRQSNPIGFPGWKPSRFRQRTLDPSPQAAEALAELLPQ